MTTGTAKPNKWSTLMLAMKKVIKIASKQQSKKILFNKVINNWQQAVIKNIRKFEINSRRKM